MKRTLMLVPGAWHGAWCWQRLTPLLAARGHRVLTPDLDASDPASVSLDHWARLLVAQLREEPAPVLLVGHSRGGLLISRMAELAPECIHRLVYVAAYLLPAGGQVATEARADAGSLIPAHMVPAVAGLSCRLRDEVIREAFYGDCDDATVAWASARLSPEPLKLLVTPLRISAEKYGRVARAYVECTRDRTVSLAAQRRMQAALPCDPVFTLESDHSPFLSRPAELAELLGGL